MSKDNQKPAPAVDAAKAPATEIMKPAVDAAKAPATTALDAAKESRADMVAFETAAEPRTSLAELARAEADLEAHAAHVERMRVALGTSRKGLAPAHRGTKTYVVGPSGHYRKGQFFKAGELITVTDEKPSKEWVPFDPNAPKAVEVPAAVAAAGRVSDQDVA